MKKYIIICAVSLSLLISGNVNGQNAPGVNFDLSAWKLQTLKASDSSFTEVNPINSHTNQFFYTNPSDGAIVFKCPSNGGKTSANTSYPRVELRQVSDGANWSLSDTNEHYLSAQCRVMTIAQAKPKTIIGQIHGSDPNSELLKIRWTGYQAGSCFVEARLQTNDAVGSEYGVVLASGLSLGDTINYTVTMKNGVVEVTINGNTATQTYTTQYYGTTDKYYFKAGTYIQWNEAIVGPTVVSGEHLFYKLTLHRFPLSTSDVKTTSFNLYPNPATKSVIINLDFLAKPQAKIELLDFKGALLKNRTLASLFARSNYSYELDVSDLKSGIYFVRFLTDKVIENRKLIITN
jgi:hypothetical protein